jgi:hypothetical protein
MNVESDDALHLTAIASATVNAKLKQSLCSNVHDSNWIDVKMCLIAETRIECISNLMCHHNKSPL